MRRTLGLLMVLCLAAIADCARADLVGLRVFREGLYGLPDPPDGPRWIYRVYAEFTETTDSVQAWGIGSSLGPGQIRNITLGGSPGTGFVNIPDDASGNLPPNNPFTTRDWDTYMTIGVVYGAMGPGGADGSELWPGTPAFISGGSTLWTGQVGFVSMSSTSSPQGRADFMILGNDTDRRVLLMQLVVNAGEHVEGTIGLLTRTDAGAIFTPGLTFSSVPSPTSLAPLAIAVFVRGRRRR